MTAGLRIAVRFLKTWGVLSMGVPDTEWPLTAYVTGDVAFQKKCLGRMDQVAREGRTVLFISHNLGAIQELCQRCIFLSHGQVVMEGDPETVVTRYLNESSGGNIQPSYRMAEDAVAKAEETAILIEAQLLDAQEKACQHLRFGEPFSVRMLWQRRKELPAACYSIQAHDERNRFLFATNTIGTGIDIEDAGLHEVVCRFDHNVLVPGTYYFSVGCYVRPHTTVDAVAPCLRVMVVNIPYGGRRVFDIVGNPAVAVQASWLMQ